MSAWIKGLSECPMSAFPPSRHSLERQACPLCAKSRHQAAYYSSRAAAATAANRPKPNVPKPSTMSARVGNARPNIASDGRLTAGKVISNAAAPAPPRPNCCKTWIIGTSPAVGITKSVPVTAATRTPMAIWSAPVSPRTIDTEVQRARRCGAAMSSHARAYRFRVFRDGCPFQVAAGTHGMGAARLDGTGRKMRAVPMGW